MIDELTLDGLEVLGRGAADRAELTAGDRRIPSMYVDPLAWLVLSSVEEALAGCPATVRDDADEVAVILVSAYGTRTTMAEIIRAVPSGRLSPLRFAGASPGGVASLACIVHGFRGPSLMLTTDPAHGSPAARTVARSWLRTGAAKHVVLSAHTALDGHRVRTVVLGAGR